MVQAITRMGTVTNAEEEAEKCMQVSQRRHLIPSSLLSVPAEMDTVINAEEEGKKCMQVSKRRHFTYIVFVSRREGPQMQRRSKWRSIKDDI
jgi:hypothetical protein